MIQTRKSSRQQYKRSLSCIIQVFQNVSSRVRERERERERERGSSRERERVRENSREFERETETETETETERQRDRDTERQREAVKLEFFVTFNFIRSHNLPENLSEIPQVVQKI